MSYKYKKKDKKKEKRLLPSDYQRKIKYGSLDNTPKRIERTQGRFFEFPEDMKGFQFQEREFLVFYFDVPEDYEIVREFFEVPTKASVSHPELDTEKLVRLVRLIRSVKEAKARERGNGEDTAAE